MSSEHFVKLDIGGTIFKTSKSTLTKFDGFFKIMLETGVPVKKDEAGCIFIDRDPSHFPKILNFMRDGDVELPDSVKELKEIQNEAQYYLLSGLVELCNAKIPQNTEETSNKTSNGTSNETRFRDPNDRHIINHGGASIQIDASVAKIHVINHEGGSVRINASVVNHHKQSSESSSRFRASNNRHVINHAGKTIRINESSVNLHVTNHRGGTIRINAPLVKLHMTNRGGGDVRINAPVQNYFQSQTHNIHGVSSNSCTMQ